MKKRLLALALTAAMLLGMIPAYAAETAEDTVITGFAALEQSGYEAETGTALEKLGLPEYVTATVLEMVTTYTGNGEGEEPTVSTEQVETEREIPVAWDSAPAYDPEQAGEYVFTASAEGYAPAEGVEWPSVTVTLTEAALPVITGFTVDGEKEYQVAAHEDMTADYVAQGLAEDVTVTASVDGQEIVLPVDWSCPDFDGQTAGVYTFTAYARGHALAEGVTWPSVTVEVTGAETAATYEVDVSEWQSLWFYAAYGGYTINLTADITTDASGNFCSTCSVADAAYLGTTTTINGNGYKITRASGFTDNLFSIGSGKTLTLNNVIIDGGTVWSTINDATSTRSSGPDVTSNLISVSSGGTLTATGSTFQNAYIGTGAYNGAAISNSGTATLTNCTFQGNFVATSGAAIDSEGTLKVDGCTIRNNRCSTSQGTIRVTGGSAIICGATQIINNYGGYGGPALYATGGTTYIYGTTAISGNTSPAGVDQGAVWVSGGSVNLYGAATISGNTALSGVYVDSGTFYLYGRGAITGNKRGVNVGSGGTLQLGNSATIIDNTSGNVVLPSGGKISLNTSITGSVGVTQTGAAAGGTFATANNASDAAASAGAFFDDAGTYKSGASGANLIWIARQIIPLDAPTVTGTTENSITIDVVGGQTYYLKTSSDGDAVQTYTATADGSYTFEGLTAETTYYISTVLIGQEEDADPYYTESDNTTAATTARTDYYVASTGSDTTGDGTREKPYATPQMALSLVPAGGTIHVMDQVTVTSVLTVGINVTITGKYTDADGVEHSEGVLKRSTSFTRGYLINVRAANVTFADITVDGNNVSAAYAMLYIGNGYAATLNNGVVLKNGHNTSSASHTYGTICVYYGALTMNEGAAITGNTASSAGGVYVEYGTFTMNGGSITGNTGSNLSCGVWVYDGGTFTMNGGSISNNTALARGAGVWVSGSRNKFTMNGGSITGNTCGGDIGGGVQGPVYLSGNVVIAGNTVNNGEASDLEGVATLTGALTEGARIGVAGTKTAAAVFATATGDNAEEIAAASAGYFFDDAGTYKSGASGANLIWIARQIITLDAPTVTGATEDSITIDVVGGQTYYLRASASGEAVQTYEAEADGTYTFTGLTASAAYYIYTGKPGQASDADPYYSDSENTTAATTARMNYYVSARGNDSTGDGTRNQPYATLAKALNTVPDGGTIYVMDTVPVSSQVTISKNVTITSADGCEGRLQRAAGSWADKSGMLSITAGSTYLKNITLDGNNLVYASSLIRVSAATLYLQTGTVLENNRYTTGSYGIGTVYLEGDGDSAKAYMDDGAVIRNNRAIYGAAVTIYNYNSGGFYMYGGEIYGNYTTNRSGGDDAGAILVGKSSSSGTPFFYMSGGSIHNNGTASTYGSTSVNAGAGVCVFEGGAVRLYGAATIRDNFLASGPSDDNSYTSGTQSNVYLSTSSTTLTVVGNLTGSVGVTQVGKTNGGTFATASSEEIASASAQYFFDDTGTYTATADGTNLIWASFQCIPDKYRIVVLSDDADETFTIGDKTGTKVYDEELGKYVTTFEGLKENTNYTVTSSTRGDQTVRTLTVTALERNILAASPFTVYEGETISLASVLGSKVAHLSGCVSLTNMTVGSTDIATVSGTGRNARITGVTTGSTTLKLTASTWGCGVYGTCNTGEIEITINVVPNVVIRTTVADLTSITVGDCSSKLQYALYDSAGSTLVSDWISPSDDGEGGLYVRFDGLSERTTYTVVARYGDGNNSYGSATRKVTTATMSALQRAIQSASPFTIYEGETVYLSSVLGGKVYHLSGCVSLSNLTVTDTGVATVSGSGRAATVTGVALGSTQITMTASTYGCYYYGTTTANGVTITVNVIPKVQIKSVSATTDSITVSQCDSRFQYALYDAQGNLVGDQGWQSPGEDGTLTWSGLDNKTSYTVVARFGDGDNAYGTASKTVTTGQVYTGTVEELYSYSQGTGVTAGFKVSMDSAPSGTYTLQVTDASGNTAGTAVLQGAYYGGNYVVKVTGLTAGTTYTVQAVVGGTAVGTALEWTASAATASSHNGQSNTSGYYSSSTVNTKTDSSGAEQVVSGISYSVKTDNRVDIQGYGGVRTTFSNAGWTVRTSGGSNLWVWAEPEIVTGESGADYVVLTYHIRNNSGADLSNVWLGANADIMIGSNDRAPVYKEDYGIRTAVGTDDDTLSFAIITQNGGGVAQYVDTVSTRWFGYHGYRSAYTFSNTSASSLTNTDSGAAFSWKVGALAAGEIKDYSVVIGVAGKDNQAKDITDPDAASTEEGLPPDTVTEQKLDAPTVTATTSDSVTVNVVKGQTYILRLAPDSESYMTYEATADGSYTFSGLAPGSTYYVYTKMTEQPADGNTVYLDSDNTTAMTQSIQAGNSAGSFDLKTAAKDEATLTYTFPNAEATLSEGIDHFTNLSIMVDNGSFSLSSIPTGYTVAGVNASGSYVTSATAGTAYTYLIFNGDFTKEQAEDLLRSITFKVEGSGTPQVVEVDADVIDLPSGVARLGSSYYRYVAYRGITWNNAYKAAKASSFNGLPGYLITVDSAVEHNFVYRTYGSVNGWMGGVRTTKTVFDGSTFDASSNPGDNTSWTWVCGPNAGTTFWSGATYSSGRKTGAYSNWNSSEPNNSRGEWAAQYGYGSGGRWNDYKPTNSAIGGYFIEYTAYDSYYAENPMAHDEEETVFQSAIADVMGSGGSYDSSHSALQNAVDQAVKVNTGSDMPNTIVKLTGDVKPETADTVTISNGNSVVLDLNGKEVGENVTIKVEAGATLYGVDTSTDGYGSSGGSTVKIELADGAQISPITTLSKEQTGTKEKSYVAVRNDDGTYSFHRINVQAAKYSVKLDTDDNSATLIFSLALQGDADATAALDKIGAVVGLDGTNQSADGEKDAPSDLTGAAANAYYYQTNLTNIINSSGVNGFTVTYDLSGKMTFSDGSEFEGPVVKRSFLQILKQYYKKQASAEEKAVIDTFVQTNNLTTEWEALG